MENLKEILATELKNCPRQLSEIIKQVIENREAEIIEHMKIASVLHASDALLEAKLSDEKIILLLQKHYDLRRSEADKALQQAKNRAAK